MFKRATWLGGGFTLGVGTTAYAARKARQHLDRYKPPAMLDRVTTTISTRSVTIKDQVTEALTEGRAAARAREQELRTEKALRAVPDLDATPSSSTSSSPSST
jgi:hypothetical protein